MTVAYCLADFFNLTLWGSGRHPTYADIRDGLEDLVAASLNAMKESGIEPSELTVRLYGGWHGDRPDSRIPLRDLTEAVIRGFPSRSGSRIRIQMAEAPIWDPSLRLLRTVREMPLRPLPGQISAPGACADAGSCSVGSLISWWKGKCPNAACRVRLADVGSAVRQKMVDTLLTADAFTIMRDEAADVLLLASDDDDILPALLAIPPAKMKGIRLRRDARPDPYYDGVLDLLGLSTYNW